MVSAASADAVSGSRQRLSEEQRRAQILTATIEVVAELGFEAVSASAIAGRAGLPRGLIWHYFDDKVQLMRHVFAQAMDQISPKLVRADGALVFSQADYEDLHLGQEALFRQAQDEGSFRQFDTRVMAVTYQGAIDGMLGCLASRPSADADSHATELAEILLAAMEKR